MRLCFFFLFFTLACAYRGRRYGTIYIARLSLDNAELVLGNQRAKVLTKFKFEKSDHFRDSILRESNNLYLTVKDDESFSLTETLETGFLIQNGEPSFEGWLSFSCPDGFLIAVNESYKCIEAIPLPVKITVGRKQNSKRTLV